MTERSRAFSFVDRITRFESGHRAEGRFTVPADLGEFPASLVAEAIGQLAAWVAMEHAGFRRRPVAALASEVRVESPPRPGICLDLVTEIDGCVRDAVTYGGLATANGVPVLRLSRCVGPLLPMEEFDAADAVRRDFELLCDTGLPPRDLSAAATVPPVWVALDRERGRRLRAELRVPAAAPFFADHFPRKPVFPGTLLLDALMRIGVDLVADALAAPARPPVALRARHVKLRSFIQPGQVLTLVAESPTTPGTLTDIALTATFDGLRVCNAHAEIAA